MINRAEIMGRLGADPEIRSFQDGGRVCNLRVVTSENWKDKKTGEKRERTQWHQVAVFNDGLVKLCETYLRKGARVWLSGQIETRKWQDQSGADRYSTEIVLRPYRGEMQVIDWPDNGGVSQGNTSGGAGGGDLDDEIPFMREDR